MEVINLRNIKIGDIIECLTEDGWESGTVTMVTDTVTMVTETNVTVFMDYIGCEREFDMDLIR